MTRTLFVSVISVSLLLWAAFPVSSMASKTDVDGDGHNAIVYGGDDCDDNDANRYPGNAEVCDAANHDEDCNLETYGIRDSDGDGYHDARCCNNGSGGPYCGNDCNDAKPSIHPTSVEICNGVDDDCDGAIDWDNASNRYINVLAYLDLDRDGWGDNNDSGIRICPDKLLIDSRSGVKGDCNDKAASINPGATEACNGLDDNCNGVKDEGLTGACN